MPQRTEYEIVNGPSKFDLMLALFDRPEGAPRFVEFKSGAKIEPSADYVSSLRVNIQKVELEDGSAESWNIAGLTADPRIRFSGWYSTKTRKGQITLES